MATPAQIRTALASAQQNRLGYAEKADLLDAAIDSALVSSSGEVELPWTTTGANGVTISRITLMDAVKLSAQLRQLDCGGVVGQYLEFTDGSR